MSRHDRVAMTMDEVAAFLGAEMKVQIATTGKDGTPHLVTMFYALLDGKIAFTTYRTSQKVLNLQRSPVMACLVEGGSAPLPSGGVAYDQLRGVSLSGKGRIITDPDLVVQVGIMCTARMAGLPVPAEGDPVDPAQRAGVARAMAKRVAIVMEPDRVASWDHRKM